ADVCLNGAPVFLDASNIFVTINNNLVPITSTGGTWVFTGPGVSGNFFYPTTLGPHAITLFYTDIYGCSGSVSITINVISCGCNTDSCNCNAQPPPPLPTITINSVIADSCNQSGCIHASFTGCC